MIIFRLFELTLLTLGLLFVVTQLLIPALKGTALFPAFRKEGKLKATLVEQRQEYVEQQLEKVVVENEQELHPAAAMIAASPETEKTESV